LLSLVPNLPVEQAFAVMDQLVSEVIKGVTDAINLPSLISLDFNDVRTVLSEGGASTVLYGESGVDEPERAVDDAMANPLLDVDYAGARGALIHLTAGPSLSLRGAHAVVEGISAALSQDANVIFGVRLDPKRGDSVRVIAIVTGVRCPTLDVSADLVASPAAAVTMAEVPHRFR